ncbi:MAG: nickel insertion protein, partial [[Clostridium] symbiosum]
MSQFTNQEKEEKLLYLECYSGISGDMTVGALLDLGASRNVLEETLKSLGVGGYHLHFGRKLKCGIDAYDFDVHLEEEEHGHG